MVEEDHRELCWHKECKKKASSQRTTFETRLVVEERTLDRSRTTHHHRHQLPCHSDHHQRQTAKPFQRFEDEELAQSAGEGVEEEGFEEGWMEGEEGEEVREGGVRGGGWGEDWDAWWDGTKKKGAERKREKNEVRLGLREEERGRRDETRSCLPRQRKKNERKGDNKGEERHEEHHLLACDNGRNEAKRRSQRERFATRLPPSPPLFTKRRLVTHQKP